MRVLHLIDDAARTACPATLALLADPLRRLGDIDLHPLLLGGRELGRAAIHAGIPLGDQARLQGVPMRQPVLGWCAIRHALRDLLPDGGHRSIDLVHGWSVSSLLLAALMMRRTPRLLTLVTPPTARELRWIRSLAAEPVPTILLPISATLRRTLLSAGVAESAVHVLRPSLDLGRVAAATASSPQGRRDCREAWGLADDDRVVALLGDPPHAADAALATLIINLTADASPVWRRHLRLVVHPDQLNRRRAQNALDNLGLSHRLIVDERLARPWELLPACDAALALEPTAGGLSLLWAMAAGVPILAHATYAVSEIVEDHHSALLARPGDNPALAQRLTLLLQDPQLAWKLRDTARHEAYSFFSRQRYCQSLVTIYRQLAQGQPVAVPDLPVTGGLRFTGRA